MSVWFFPHRMAQTPQKCWKFTTFTIPVGWGGFAPPHPPSEESFLFTYTLALSQGKFAPLFSPPLPFQCLVLSVSCFFLFLSWNSLPVFCSSLLLSVSTLALFNGSFASRADYTFPLYYSSSFHSFLNFPTTTFLNTRPYRHHREPRPQPRLFPAISSPLWTVFMVCLVQVL